LAIAKSITLVLRVGCTVQLVGIADFSAVVVLADLESGHAEDREAVPAALGHRDVEDGKPLGSKSCGSRGSNQASTHLSFGGDESGRKAGYRLGPRARAKHEVIGVIAGTLGAGLYASRVGHQSRTRSVRTTAPRLFA
jgi:hypothetical protein